MPASGIVKNRNDGRITLKSAGGALSLVVPLDEGDFGVQGLGETLQAVSAYVGRGRLQGLRHADPEFPQLSWSCKLANFRGNTGTSTTGSVVDALTRKGAWAAAVSTTLALGDVYTLDVVLDVEGTDLTDSADHSVTFHDVHLRFDVAEGDPDMVSISGTVYGEVDGDLEAALY